MALGDGIRRNIAHVDPAERALLRDALVEMSHRFHPGSRTDSVPGGVSWWFKQDEIHQATHVHRGPEFLPWHREIVNRMEESLRAINPQLSLHYWDWTQDPRAVPNANLGGGTTGNLNLFTTDFMGWGGPVPAELGAPWKAAGYYDPATANDRDVTGNPADPPKLVTRFVAGSPANPADDAGVIAAGDFAAMRGLLEIIHNAMHGFVNMGGAHISFRDPFVFLLHSNVDRLYAMWQTQAGHPDRLDGNLIYGSESGDPGLNGNVEPWSTGLSTAFGGTHRTRPWYAPVNQGVPHNYKHPSLITPPCSREELRSAATWIDRPPTPTPTGDDPHRWCELILCVLQDDRAGRALEERGVNVDGVRDCVKRFCQRRWHLAGARRVTSGAASDTKLGAHRPRADGQGHFGATDYP